VQLSTNDVQWGSQELPWGSKESHLPTPGRADLEDGISEVAETFASRTSPTPA
jgi:hypothetical protein